MLQCDIFFCWGIKIQWHHCLSPKILLAVSFNFTAQIRGPVFPQNTLLQSLPVPVSSDHSFVHTSANFALREEKEEVGGNSPWSVEPQCFLSGFSQISMHLPHLLYRTHETFLTSDFYDSSCYDYKKKVSDLNNIRWHTRTKLRKSMPWAALDVSFINKLHTKP